MIDAEIQKTIILFGGTGFIGSAVTRLFLTRGWRVIIPTRCQLETDARSKLIHHGVDDTLIEQSLRCGSLMFILEFNLSDPAQSTHALKTHPWNTGPNQKIVILHCAAESTGQNTSIITSNTSTIEAFVICVRFIKEIFSDVVVCYVGSIAEYSHDTPLPPYERSKKTAWQILQQSNCIDAHFIPGYVKGKGETKMTEAAHGLWALQSWSRRWLWDHDADVIDVDSLARMVGWFVGIDYRDTSLAQMITVRPLDILPLNGTLPFGEMVRHLLPSSKRDVKIAPLLSGSLEHIFLKLFSWVIRKTFPQNQYLRRLAFFARRATEPSWGYTKTFLDGDSIRKLSQEPKYHFFQNKNQVALQEIANTTLWIAEVYSRELLLRTISASTTRANQNK